MIRVVDEGLTAIFTRASLKIPLQVALSAHKQTFALYAVSRHIPRKLLPYSRVSLARNAFIDGSKRADFLARELFLEQNGYFVDPKAQITSFLLALAQNNVDLETFADWHQSHA
jgi:hypothetical protein